MSKLAKILIPLITDKTTKENYTKDAGFIDLYTFDMDKYKNYKGLYLMFDATQNTTASKQSSIALSKQLNLNNVYTKIIDNKPYTIYSFFIPENIKDMTENNICTLTAEQKMKIASFWGKDDSIFRDVLCSICIQYDCEAVMPSQDVLTSLIEYLHEGVLYDKRETA